MGYGNNDTPVKSSKHTATGVVTADQSKLIGLWIRAAAAQGNLVLTDGNGGSSKFDIDTMASLDETQYINLGGYIEFPNGIWIGTFANIGSITLVYDGT